MTFNDDISRPDTEAFSKYIDYFLNDNPGTNCPKGGHAAYGDVRQTFPATKILCFFTIAV